MTTIAIGADHAGYEFKELLKKHFSDFSFQDFGTHSTQSVDYPDFAHPVAEAVHNGQYPLGILLCGSGEGVCITANKHAGIRAALCWTPEIASLSRQHNNANILCIPARFISEEEMYAITNAFLTTSFEGGRHEARVEKIDC